MASADESKGMLKPADSSTDILALVLKYCDFRYQLKTDGSTEK